MDERKEAAEAEIQEHCPEHWFSIWERECLDDAEQEAPEEDDRLALEREQAAQKLWLSFQNSATAVAQLYKDRVCQQQGVSLWIPFQNAASAVTNLYKDGAETHRRSYEHGAQMGLQRRTRDVLAWAKKRRRTIRREDLISFLCGKSPPPPPSRGGCRAPARLSGIPASPRVAPTEPSPTDDTDLQPFREAIALHGLSGAMASISMRSGNPGSPTHAAGGSGPSRRRSSLHDMDLNTFISEEMALHLEGGTTTTTAAAAMAASARKRSATSQCPDVITDSPTHKRSRLI
ncbi:HUWE1-associated protein modifying stress responses-like isoform X1 [Lethenteron reissneri]|uniref:HUWE1-associated protein modifying stress responses-like isoform X1 n=1 Tax=Lethenteron reissneri TaxID=7753 RepID=UPI002AB6CB29|nr:HUWE1-associated protein modifying stress responses-like isoform X1 [Lethenteron reissneri]